MEHFWKVLGPTELVGSQRTRPRTEQEQRQQWKWEAQSADLHVLMGTGKVHAKKNSLWRVLHRLLRNEFEQLLKISRDLKQTMSDYFITMAKMIDIMWEEADSIVGPARGSAASSLINYLLGITQIDPLA